MIAQMQAADANLIPSDPTCVDNENDAVELPTRQSELDYRYFPESLPEDETSDTPNAVLSSFVKTRNLTPVFIDPTLGDDDYPVGVSSEEADRAEDVSGLVEEESGSTEPSSVITREITLAESVEIEKRKFQGLRMHMDALRNKNLTPAEQADGASNYIDQTSASTSHEDYRGPSSSIDSSIIMNPDIFSVSDLRAMADADETDPVPIRPSAELYERLLFLDDDEDVQDNDLQFMQGFEEHYPTLREDYDDGEDYFDSSESEFEAFPPPRVPRSSEEQDRDMDPAASQDSVPEFKPSLLADRENDPKNDLSAHLSHSRSASGRRKFSNNLTNQGEMHAVHQPSDNGDKRMIRQDTSEAESILLSPADSDDTQETESVPLIVRKRILSAAESTESQVSRDIENRFPDAPPPSLSGDTLIANRSLLYSRENRQRSIESRGRELYELRHRSPKRPKTSESVNNPKRAVAQNSSITIDIRRVSATWKEQLAEANIVRILDAITAIVDARSVTTARSFFRDNVDVLSCLSCSILLINDLIDEASKIHGMVVGTDKELCELATAPIDRAVSAAADVMKLVD
ncbi:hypothetical protein BZA70DRAFT_268270 [Myxozyma melibiosi]|uniref:Uncharacterized protein n=1 Tax=Myxozyma melibiosi TaxID=54550 RepID=A0ABR1F3P6_9ASCO